MLYVFMLNSHYSTVYDFMLVKSIHIHSLGKLNILNTKLRNTCIHPAVPTFVLLLSQELHRNLLTKSGVAGLLGYLRLKLLASRIQVAWVSIMDPLFVVVTLGRTETFPPDFPMGLLKRIKLTHVCKMCRVLLFTV